MKFKDKQSSNYQAAVKDLYAAIASNDEGQMEQSFANFSEALADEMQTTAKTELNHVNQMNNDQYVLAQRGLRKPLTTHERKFFAEAVEKQKIEGLEETFPTTIIEDVMKDLTNEHPLLSEIDTQYTEAAIKYIYGDPAEQTAFWDVIPADIRQILIGAIKVLDITASKLSGFIALPKGYFQLGANWLAQYVINFLTETMSATLEDAVVNGDGKLKPIGMMRQLSNAVDGVYPAKPTVALNDLTPKSFAGPRALLARNKMINGKISLIINPVTYETKVAPNLFFQNTMTGVWQQLALPYGENVIQSYAVPENLAVLGNAQNYLLAVAGQTEIRKYEETLAIEDMDLYIAKFFGAGVPKNPNAFVVLDLANIDGVTVPDDEADAEVVSQDTFSPRANKGSHALDRDGNSTGAEIGNGTGGFREGGDDEVPTV